MSNLKEYYRTPEDTPDPLYFYLDETHDIWVTVYPEIRPESVAKDEYMDPADLVGVTLNTRGELGYDE